MTTEVKQEVEKLHSLFDDFKKANDERLKEIENKGTPDPVLNEKVEKINAAISEQQEKVDSISKQVENRLDDVEARFATSGKKGSDDEEMQKAARFFSLQAGKPVSPSEVDIESYRQYGDALNAYIRRGDAVNAEIKNALSVGSDPDGGYLVKPEMSDMIMRLVYETSPVRQVANVVTVGSDALEGINDLDEAGSGWVGETESRTETDTPQVGEWRIPVHEQYAEPRATQKMLDDSMLDVESWLNGKVADKLARRENTAFVSGDGIKKPRGFLTYASGTPSASSWNVIEQTNSGASGAFAASDPGDVFLTTIGKMKSSYRANAVWGMNRTTEASVRKLKDGDGNYLWQPSFQAGTPSTLAGYRVVLMEDMPDLAADSLSIVFGDFNSGYMILDRSGIRILRDPYTSKPYVKFYTTKRVGGDVVNFEALKLIKFAS